MGTEGRFGAAMGSRRAATVLLSTLLNSAVVMAAGPFELHRGGACPTFHCTQEANSAMSIAPATGNHSVAWQVDRGSIAGQGCSGNSEVLACLFSRDPGSGGTLKVFDPVTRSELWSSKKADSFNLSSYAASGQVPYLTSNGQFYAADDVWVARYDSNGTLVNKLALSGSSSKNSFGVLGLNDTTALVNNSNGRLTAFDLETMSKRSELQLTTPAGANIGISSPGSASEGRAYFVTNADGVGLLNSFLMAVDQNSAGALQKSWSFAFRGRSGASATVLTPAVSGRPFPLILLHTPGGSTGAKAHKLVAIEDWGASSGVAWAISLPGTIRVSPLVDPINKRIYYQTENEYRIHAVDFAGNPVATYDLRALTAGTVPNGLLLNGHLFGSFTPEAQTLFITVAASGQYAIGLDSLAGSVRWVVKTADSADLYTGAWTMQVTPSGNCPIFVGVRSGINMLCPP